jgi:septal ring factor EnvC (AmiA/AmiB activator)
MKAVVVACLLFTACALAAEEAWPFSGGAAGYVPTSGPFQNPKTLTERTPTIPNSPDCSVRPQTVVEIQRMRESASRIAQMIEAEVQIMNKRKSFVEQMTTYLNDRIRELNKVKGELAEETRWIEVSTNRIQELAEREKLVKMQDILACLNGDKRVLTDESTAQSSTIEALKSQSEAVSKRIAEIKAKIEAAAEGKEAAPAAAEF